MRTRMASKNFHPVMSDACKDSVFPGICCYSMTLTLSSFLLECCGFSRFMWCPEGVCKHTRRDSCVAGGSVAKQR